MVRTAPGILSVRKPISSLRPGDVVVIAGWYEADAAPVASYRTVKWVKRRAKGYTYKAGWWWYRAGLNEAVAVKPQEAK